MDDDPFAAEYNKKKKEAHRCHLCKGAAKLSVTRRKQLRDALLGRTKVAGRRIPIRTITDVLNAWGIETSTTVVSHHVSGTDLSKECREQVANAWGAEDAE